MERIRRVGQSMILSDLAKKGMCEGRGEERMDSMNVVPDTVVRKKEETQRGVKTIEMEENESITPIVTNKTALKSVIAVVSDLRGWESVDCSVSEMVISSNCCNEVEVKDVDLGRFTCLKVFVVGDECFGNVNEVKLIGLSQLERVVIGMNSFTKYKGDWPKNNPNRYFYLKNCERVRELKIGCASFNYYSVCEIVNVPSLEVIEMGELNEYSYNFHNASLELKSDCERTELINRLAQFEIISGW